MTRTLSLAFFCLLLLMVFGCATHQPGYEKPAVTISSFEAVPSQGIVPKFKIGLHIVNPNRTPLELKGIAYTIALEGRKIMTGVSNKLPKIEAYGEGSVELNAVVDLFSSIGFFTDLMKTGRLDAVNYSFTAKLDAGSFHPLIRVKREGKLSLDDTMINSK